MPPSHTDYVRSNAVSGSLKTTIILVVLETKGERRRKPNEKPKSEQGTKNITEEEEQNEKGKRF